MPIPEQTIKTQPGHSRGVDQVKLERTLLLLFGVVSSVVLGYYTIRSGNPFLMFGFVSLPFLLMLMNRPDIGVVLALIMDATGLPMPGAPHVLMGAVFKVIIVGAAFLAQLMGQKRHQGRRVAENLPMKIFTGITLVIMAVRGTGLRIFGSSTWGGMTYVVLITTFIFYFSTEGITLTKKQFRYAVWGSLISGLIGTVISYRGGALQLQGLGIVAEARLMWMMPLVFAIFPLIFAVRWKSWLSIPLWLACLAGMSLTGFRGRTLSLVLITLIFFFYRQRHKSKFMAAALGLLAIGWIGLILISPALPLGMQRAISYVPGTTIDEAMKSDAEGSIEWRIQIWDHCIKESAPYLLIGRGSAFNVWEASKQVNSNDISTMSPWFAFQTRSYHSGPLTLLIDYGIPGLMTGIWMTILCVRRLMNYMKRLAIWNVFESRYAVIFCAGVIWRWIQIYTGAGGIPTLSTLIADTALAVVLCVSAMKIAQDNDPFGNPDSDLTQV